VIGWPAITSDFFAPLLIASRRHASVSVHFLPGQKAASRPAINQFGLLIIEPNAAKSE